MKKNIIYLFILILGLATSIFVFNLQSDTQDIAYFASFHQGESKSYVANVTKYSTGKSADLTGFTVRFILKKNESDTTPVLNLACTNYTQSGSTKGQAYVTLSKTNTDGLATGTHYAYFVLTNGAGTIFEVIQESKVVVKPRLLTLA